MMLLGAQTVTVRNFGTSQTRDRFNAPTRTVTSTEVFGCVMQPMSITETVTLTEIATEMWRCFLPPVPAALAVDTTSEIVYESMTFQVIGSEPSVDFMGRRDHVRLELKKQIA